MTENKQIEEMARDLEAYTCMSGFQAEIGARALYAKDYRKVERGEWIAKPQEFYIGDTDWMCSVCKEEFCPIDMVQDDFFKTMKFCPNCGADMRGDGK